MKAVASVKFPAVDRIVRGLGDVVFPPVCLECGGLVGEAHGFRHLCESCARRIEFVHEPACPTCGHPWFGAMELGRVCEHCRHLEPDFGRGRTATLFRGPVRTLVIELKYHRALHVLEDLNSIFVRSPELLDLTRGSILVPVPLHARKKRERGFNQSQLFAEGIAELSEGACVQPLLVRSKDTPTQTAFDRKHRATNLKNAFALAPGATLNRHRHHVLVDDVFTTGSTLNECARVLRRAGCLSVDVVTLCHG
jgi:ComF family protein